MSGQAVSILDVHTRFGFHVERERVYALKMINMPPHYKTVKFFSQAKAAGRTAEEYEKMGNRIGVRQMAVLYLLIQGILRDTAGSASWSNMSNPFML